MPENARVSIVCGGSSCNFCTDADRFHWLRSSKILQNENTSYAVRSFGENVIACCFKNSSELLQIRLIRKISTPSRFYATNVYFKKCSVVRIWKRSTMIAFVIQ